jgi:hypothetical protein
MANNSALCFRATFVVRGLSPLCLLDIPTEICLDFRKGAVLLSSIDRASTEKKSYWIEMILKGIVFRRWTSSLTDAVANWL